MEEQYIYLVFTKTGTWLSTILKYFSETKYVHSSIGFHPALREMYSFGRTNPDNPFSGGLVEEDLYGGVYKKFSSSECLIYRVQVTQDQLQQIQEEIADFLLEKEKYRYNLLGLFGILLNLPIKRRNHYFCSQFISELLMKSKVLNLDKVPELIRTHDLLAIDNKELIYKGFTQQYASPDETLAYF